MCLRPKTEGYLVTAQLQLIGSIRNKVIKEIIVQQHWQYPVSNYSDHMRYSINYEFFCKILKNI